MRRSRATLVLIVAWVAGCAGTKNGGPGAGATTGATSGTSGSSGAMCTSEGGPSQFTGPLVGACVSLTSTCGDEACVDYLGSIYMDVGQMPCQGDSSKAWFPGSTCNRLVPNLKGGCEIISASYQATDIWYSSAGEGDCWTCSTCAINGSICLQGLPKFTACEQEMPMTGSTSGTGGTGGSSGGGGSSSSSGGVSCVGTLTGGPVAGSASYSCTASENNVNPTLVRLLFAAEGPGDGGWRSTNVEVELPQPITGLTPGSYSSAGSAWVAKFISPSGNEYGSASDAGGEMSVTITGSDMYGDLGGTATVVVPTCSPTAPGCDGGYITAQYVFSD